MPATWRTLSVLSMASRASKTTRATTDASTPIRNFTGTPSTAATTDPRFSELAGLPASMTPNFLPGIPRAASRRSRSSLACR
ncbi:hypothetical protein PR001_g15946 [Phytophthora rubi]|uniref:Uncharacterized protein n=1 Tax=Phytophthora rubi TaxID=129364 RepID=A0A6A3KVE2_9STRA|nr:hypothetical protein PR001_g15946 [Phytophthora rubi]